MRRAGYNPTDVEVHDLINKIDNGSVLNWKLYIFLKGKSRSSFLDELYLQWSLKIKKKIKYEHWDNSCFLDQAALTTRSFSRWWERRIEKQILSFTTKTPSEPSVRMMTVGEFTKILTRLSQGLVKGGNLLVKWTSLQVAFPPRNWSLWWTTYLARKDFLFSGENRWIIFLFLGDAERNWWNDKDCW